MTRVSYQIVHCQIGHIFDIKFNTNVFLLLFYSLDPIFQFFLLIGSCDCGFHLFNKSSKMLSHRLIGVFYIFFPSLSRAKYNLFINKRMAFNIQPDPTNTCGKGARYHSHIRKIMILLRIDLLEYLGKMNEENQKWKIKW